MWGRTVQLLMPGYAVQAFAAVQASVVHLQGVPLSKRFALVPLGPPILSYSSTSKVLAFHNLPLGISYIQLFPVIARNRVCLVLQR